MDIQDYLAQCVQQQAADLHLCAGEVPMLRLDGDLVRIHTQALTHETLYPALLGLMDAGQQAVFRQSLACDFAFASAHAARFRANVFCHVRGVSAVFRRIPERIARLEELNAPPVVSELLRSTRGLVLVTGPTGSGKSTTLAAMIDALNRETAQHIVMIEDPIEYLHSSRQCLIHQRELGAHTPSFEEALRAAMRQDPDVLLVGEMRDAATMRLALTAAETGHLVLATLHTSGAAKTIDRIIDGFAAQDKEMVRGMLSESLTAVISQVLCKRKGQAGRVAAYEVMVATSGIRHLIREGKVAQMYSAMQIGSAAGMQTLDQHLAALLKQGVIDAAQARAKAKYPESFGREVHADVATCGATTGQRGVGRGDA